MSLPLAVRLVDASFHASWSLWIQWPLFLLVGFFAGRVLFRVGRELRLGRVAWALIVALPLVLAVLLPQSSYHFSGHEGAYSELLAGELPDATDLTGHRTFALPAGLSWGMGQVLGERSAQSLWLVGNRLALPLCLLALAWSGLLSRRRQAGALGEKLEESGGGLLACAVILGAVSTPALLGWSATGFAILPALSLGLLSLTAGLAGRPAVALALGALALGCRMETAPLLMAALLIPDRAAWRSLGRGRGLAGLCAALGLFALHAFTLSQKRSELPVEDLRPDPSVFLENLLAVPLGGPWLGPAALALGALLVAWRLVGGGDRRGQLGLLVGLAVALLQPLFLVDVGARHFLPAVCLLLLLAVPAAARAWTLGGSGLSPLRVLAVLLGVAVVVPGLIGAKSLVQRYMTGFDAVPPAWRQTADEGGRGTAEDLLQDRCYLVLPGGADTWRGSRDSRDVREVHRAALALGAGWCVQWVIDTDMEFSGDTRAERFDRAVHTLGLRPARWLDPPPDGGPPWLVLEAGPSHEPHNPG